MANQLKQGLYKEYILQSEELSVLRGKLNLQGTIKTEHNIGKSWHVNMMNYLKIIF